MIGELLPDIPRIYTAIAQCLACFVFVSVYSERRFRTFKLCVLGAFFLFVQSVLLIITADAQGFLWFLFMSISWFFMFLFIFTVCKMPWTDACYYTFHAFVLAEFAASLEWQIHCFIWPVSDAPYLQATVLLIGTYAAVFVGSWLLIKRFMRGSGSVSLNITYRQLIHVAAIGISVFAISNLGFLTTQTPFSGHYHREIFNVRTIMGLCGLLSLAFITFIGVNCMSSGSLAWYRVFYAANSTNISNSKTAKSLLTTNTTT